MIRYGQSTLFMALIIALCAWHGPTAADEIRIGFSGPLSGVAAEYGQDVVNGIELAVKEINAGGGITVAGKRYTVLLERLDDRADPTQAVNNARRFKSNGAIAVFNAVFGTSAAMMRINEEPGHEFLVLAFTSTPRITDMGNKLTVVVPGPFSSMAHISADWAFERGWKKCAMAVTVGPYGDEWRKVFREIWENRGGTITSDRPANYYTETDYSAVLAATLATKPDVMLIGGPSSTTALMIEQARGMGFRGGFIMIDQAKLDYVREVLQGTRVMGNLIGAAGAAIPPREGQDFAQRYRKAYGRAATAESAFNFTFMHALARAIEAAGTVNDVHRIREAFPQAFPMYATEFPMEAYGLTEEGRALVTTATQTITEGELDPPELYFWWPKTREAFEAVEKSSRIDRSIPRRWLTTD
ncbi:ABC transporter substrate-binding protein [Desulfatitalea alkaliphila]|uniref:ABC transporter substrate-binding protein n=1 Tax=Desulfatitalea alkaliphila TaxID=2929485 RepID=A0AA41QZI0_9BACT|nr:ABC transporter substrate-binding protein [Desulfatitalea alkaliphila]MCJ8499219.1 ABC transporter substrate-binding protein [Desulfatitalea alkaliphila]